MECNLAVSGIARANLSSDRRSAGEHLPRSSDGVGGRLHFGDVRNRRRVFDDAALDLHRDIARGRGRKRGKPYRRVVMFRCDLLLAAERDRSIAGADATGWRIFGDGRRQRVLCLITLRLQEHPIKAP